MMNIQSAMLLIDLISKSVMVGVELKELAEKIKRGEEVTAYEMKLALGECDGAVENWKNSIKEN